MTDTIEISGETVSGLIINPGTILDVGSGGIAIGTLVKDGGTEITVSGGITSDAAVRAGGTELVSAGGTAISVGVKDAGALVVSAGGSAVSAQVSGGGTMIVSSGGTGIDTGSGAAAVISVTSVVSGGQVVSGLTIGSNTILDVESGGTAISTIVRGGGLEVLTAGGFVSGTVVSGGGLLSAFGAGTALDTVVYSGGSFVMSDGGVASGTVVSSGGYASVTIVVHRATSTGLIVDSVTTLYVAYGGVTSGTIITSGGHEIVDAGTDFGTTVGAGGFETVSGNAYDPVVSGELDVTGEVFGAVIADGGQEIVSDGINEAGLTSDTTITGSGTLDIEAGFASGTIDFAEEGRFIYDELRPLYAMLSGFGPGNSIELQALPFASGASASYADGELVVTAGGSTEVLLFAGNYDGASFNLTSASATDDGTLITVSNLPCFAAGTQLLTERGPVPVERLALGDRLVTTEKTAEPIIWIGSRSVDCRRHPDPAAIQPVRIAAHAFGPRRPARDLFLSPDHALFAEGVLIPVKQLINGGSVAQVAWEAVTYLHVELPRHAVILAEGLPVESYLDTGDRRAFAGTTVTMLHPVFGDGGPEASLVAEALGYAPLQVTGPEVERVRAALAPAPERRAARVRRTRSTSGPTTRKGAQASASMASAISCSSDPKAG
jgi:autotransporter passenger strand-loop-strand repeat protein